MTFEQLRVFVAVAERQHVTRAAVALNMGQSAVSAAIGALEHRHGTKLFHRVGRGITLTEPGERFLAPARAILAQVEAAERLLADLRGGNRGTLLVQASQTIASYWLPRHLAAFRQAHPCVDIRLTIGNSAQAAAAVQAGEVELGFVEGTPDDSGLRSQVVARDQLIIVVALAHPWATRPSVSAAELLETDWVQREPGSGTRAEFELAVAAFGHDPAALRTVLELPSNEAVRGAVEAGLGAAALSASVASPSLEAGLLCQVHLDLPARNFYVLQHAQRFVSQTAQAFLAMLETK